MTSSSVLLFVYFFPKPPTLTDGRSDRKRSLTETFPGGRPQRVDSRYSAPRDRNLYDITPEPQCPSPSVTTSWRLSETLVSILIYRLRNSLESVVDHVLEEWTQKVSSFDSGSLRFSKGDMVPKNCESGRDDCKLRYVQKKTTPSRPSPLPLPNRTHNVQHLVVGVGDG